MNELELMQSGKPYWIVYGKRGIGKTLFIKALKEVNPDIIYVEVQCLFEVDIRFCKKASKIIHLMEVDFRGLRK